MYFLPCFYYSSSCFKWTEIPKWLKLSTNVSDSPKMSALLSRGLYTSIEYQTPVDLGEWFPRDYNPISPQTRLQFFWRTVEDLATVRSFRDFWLRREMSLTSPWARSVRLLCSLLFVFMWFGDHGAAHCSTCSLCPDQTVPTPTLIGLPLTHERLQTLMCLHWTHLF